MRSRRRPRVPRTRSSSTWIRTSVRSDTRRLFGGSGRDSGEAFVVDEANDLVYLAGVTLLYQGAPLTPVPVSPGAFQSSPAGGGDLYVAVLDRTVPGSTSLAYGTLLGGSRAEAEVGDLTLESNGIVTLSGETLSTDLSTTAGALRTGNSDRSSLLARFDTQATGASSLLYCTYIGGSGIDFDLVHATDAAEIVHLALTSYSADLPVTPNALQSTPGVNSDLYYAQLDLSQTGSAALRYGSWMVTGRSEEAADIAVANGRAALFSWVNGYPPTTPGAFIPSCRSTVHGYVQVLDLTSQPDPFIEYATHYQGCPYSQHDKAMAFDGSEVVLVGDRDAPVTAGAARVQPMSNVDGFVGRLQLGPWPSAFESFGTACAGSAGTPQMVGRGGVPRICGTMGLRATGLPPHAAGILTAGTSRTLYLGVPLPFPLAGLGAPGCEISVAPDVILYRFADATGHVDVDIPLPAQPSLFGESLFAQFIQLDPAANAFGLVTSNGLRAEVRW